MLTIHSGTPGTTDTRGNQLADSISISSFAVLNTDSPTRIRWESRPQFSRCIISISSLAYLITSSEYHTHDHELRLSAHPLLDYRKPATSSPARHRTYINLKKDDWTRYMQEIERKLRSRHLPTDCQNRSPATRSPVQSRAIGIAEHTALTLSASST